MTTDIKQRLRDMCQCSDRTSKTRCTRCASADRIEALEGEVERLRGAIEAIVEERNDEIERTRLLTKILGIAEADAMHWRKRHELEQARTGSKKEVKP